MLRRQDESIVVFFLAVALFLILKSRHTLAAAAIGLSLLVKLSGGLLLPVAFFNKRKWRYVILPPLVFMIGLAPFLLLAGREAIFWDFTKSDTQHPFQFGGVSLFSLWNQMNTETGSLPILPLAILMVIGVVAALLLIFWKRFGVVEDAIILTTVVFLLTPKLHTGYFSLLVLLMAIAIKKWQLALLSFIFGAMAVVADFYKWPVIDYQVAFWLMVAVLLMMVLIAVAIFFQSPSGSGANKHDNLALASDN